MRMTSTSSRPASSVSRCRAVETPPKPPPRMTICWREILGMVDRGSPTRQRGWIHVRIVPSLTRRASELIHRPQAPALGGENSAPLADEEFVGLADGADLAVQVVEADGVHAVVFFSHGGVPVDLIGQAVP